MTDSTEGSLMFLRLCNVRLFVVRCEIVFRVRRMRRANARRHICARYRKSYRNVYRVVGDGGGGGGAVRSTRPAPARRIPEIQFSTTVKKNGHFRCGLLADDRAVTKKRRHFGRKCAILERKLVGRMVNQGRCIGPLIGSQSKEAFNQGPPPPPCANLCSDPKPFGGP